MVSKAAIITGPTGQDGSYLTEFMLEKGYDVKCLIRRCTYPLSSSNLKVKSDNVQIYEGDILDQPIIHKMIQDCEDYERVEIYNLAAQSHVGVSFNCPKYTFEANTLGILNILETVRQNKNPDKFRVYQASTSEMFGKVQEIPQKETTPFYPRSVYGVSKMAAHWLVKNYRESYGIHASAGILFNHESPRRGIDFVTKKIVIALKNIFAGEQEYLELGNMDAKRDWGHAQDYIEAMWMMLQQENPDDYVVATGKTYSVREFVNMCCKQMNKEIIWSGEGENEVGTCDGKVIVRVSKKFYRPCEVDLLVGDSTKVQNIGWNPKHDIESLIKDMIDN